MRNTKHNLFRSGISVLILSLLSLANCGDITPRKDYILVIDTSASMLSPHASDKKNTTYKVLTDEIGKFLDVLQVKDGVHLYTFDAETKYIDSFQAKSEDGLDQVRADVTEAISEIQPMGKWTYTKQMLHSIAAATSKLNTKGRQSIVLIFSDGKDDPPPGAKKKKQKLAGVASLPDDAVDEDAGDGGFLHEFVAKENMMYYVQLSKLQNEFLDESMTGLAPGAQSFDASGDLGGRLGEVKSRIQTEIVDRYFYKNWLFLGLAILGLLLAIFLLYVIVRLWRYRMRLRGYITYHEKGFSFDEKTIHLDEFSRMKLVIGRSVDAHARVRDLESKNDLILKATGPLMEPKIKFGNEPDDFIHHGDAEREVFYENMKFQLGNIMFRYNWENPIQEEDDENYLG